jgi:hypothetical protein
MLGAAVQAYFSKKFRKPTKMLALFCLSLAILPALYIYIAALKSLDKNPWLVKY